MRGKTRQNAENKQTFDITAKIKIEEKTRQNAENKQTLDLSEKIEIEKKLVKSLKITKLFSNICHKQKKCGKIRKKLTF